MDDKIQKIFGKRLIYELTYILLVRKQKQVRILNG